MPRAREEGVLPRGQGQRACIAHNLLVACAETPSGAPCRFSNAEFGSPRRLGLHYTGAKNRSTLLRSMFVLT